MCRIIGRWLEFRFYSISIYVKSVGFCVLMQKPSIRLVCIWLWPPCLEKFVFLGMYVNAIFSVYALHIRSSSFGGIFPCLFCRPMRAISLLKLPHNMYVWFGYAVI